MVYYMDNETLKKYGYKLIKKNDPFWMYKTKGVTMSRYHFNIIFKTGLKNAKLLEPRMGEVGLDMIDEIREVCKVPDISIDDMNIDLSCSYYRDNEYCISMSEEEARKIPQFRGSNKINVTIPEEYLTKYYGMRFQKRITPRKSYPGDYPLFRLLLNSIGIWKVPYKSDTYIKTVDMPLDMQKYCYVDTITVWFQIDNDALITDWIADGCPTYWNITEIKAKRLKFIERVSTNDLYSSNKKEFINSINSIDIEDTVEFNKVIKRCIRTESMGKMKELGLC